MDFITIIISISIGFFITEFEPLHYLLDAVREKANNKVASFFVDMFSCWKCTTFWTALILTQNFFAACVAVLAQTIIERWIEKD